MNKNYTLFNEESISAYPSIDDNLKAVDFLKDPGNFRPFHEGLTELLRRKNFQYNPDNQYETADYLISKLREISSDIEKETVYSWFSGKHRPKIEPGSRKHMYEICFALHLSYEETVWFFHHVYYDRCFNCHTIDEAVYYYAFLHGISYPKALDIIKAIYSAPVESTQPDDITSGYTQFVQNQISEFQTISELQEFLIANKQTFLSWNTSALKVIRQLLSEMTGDESSKPVIEHLKRSLMRNHNSNHNMNHFNEIIEKDIEQCGLLMKELFFDAKNTQPTESSVAEYIWETIYRKNTFKNVFVLDRLLNTVSGMQKNTDIPYIVRNNFPSKKVLSNVLDESKAATSKSYDSIRKTLVLLDFYVFWVRVKLGLTHIAGYDTESLFEIYREEADTRLYQCGYESLYAGNPYDWLFLCAAKNEEPLTFLRSCVAELLPPL